MSGTGGLRKVRFAPPSWHSGKRGASRVCYVHVIRADANGLMVIFAKNEKPNLSAQDKAKVAKLVKVFQESFPRKKDGDDETGDEENNADQA